MSQSIHRLGMLSALVALAAVQGAARAEEPDDYADSRAGSDAGKKPQSSHASADENRKRSDPRIPNERGSVNDRRSVDHRAAAAQVAPMAVVPSRVNEAFTFPIAGGCDYSATVRGTVRPARGSSGDEPKYVPSLTVNAWISCQNNTELRVTDNSLRETPMTRGELEQAIELRATLLAESATTRCAYVPDFSLGDSKLVGAGISYLCPMVATPVGGGPADVDVPDDTAHPPLPTERPADLRAPSNVRQLPENRPATETRGSTELRPKDRASSDEPK